MAGVAVGLDYGVLPPEINSGRMWAGPGSGSLAASGAAWQALAAELGSSAAGMQAVIAALTTGSWTGPTSMTMAAAAAPYVVWMLATAAQCEEAAMAAAQAAMAFEAAHAGVVPPPEIEENRVRLAALVASNIFGINSIPIAATEADYERMWAQDSTVMYGYSADAAGLTGSLIPFVPPPPTANPAGFASQAAGVAEAGGTAAGQAAQKASTAGADAAAMMPGGMDAQSMLSMGPQFMGMIPQVLQGFSQPLQGLSSPMQGLGQFQSLLSPFMGMVGNPAMMGGLGASGAGPAAAALGSGPAMAGGAGGGFGGAGAGGISAGLGNAARVGGLSVPATWAASAQGSASGSPLSVGGAAASSGSAPASAGATGMGGAPMAAMAPRDSDHSGGEPRYGTPVKVLPRPR